MTLAERLDPQSLGYSPKMSAIMGAILSHDYGVRDGKGRQLVSLSITSDGFVIAGTDPVSSGTFLGDARDLDTNLARLLADANLTADEMSAYRAAYSRCVTDWRSKRIESSMLGVTA